MLSSSLDTLLKLSKTTYPQKLFANDCVTLYVNKKAGCFNFLSRILLLLYVYAVQQSKNENHHIGLYLLINIK